ncbi:CbrC family protein [Deinococcus marmoris]|uniref:CbrC family protein n=1 Tax=Deinococcus marmoris TaxID=249408 RepID=UPI00096AAA6E|nr:CbrC family protein [Deinococcus marmoris]
MSETWAEFHYYADPTGDSVFEQTSIVCSACGKHREWKYQGVFYSIHDDLVICPWCIADGLAAKKFDGEFQEADFAETASRDSVLAVRTRTPSVATWNPIFWPDHCSECCQYIGDLRNHWSVEIIESATAQADIRAIAEITRMTTGEILEWAKRGAIYLRLFQCVQCGNYRLALDLD